MRLLSCVAAAVRRRIRLTVRTRSSGAAAASPDAAARPALCCQPMGGSTESAASAGTSMHLQPGLDADELHHVPSWQNDSRPTYHGSAGDEIPAGHAKERVGLLWVGAIMPYDAVRLQRSETDSGLSLNQEGSG